MRSSRANSAAAGGRLGKSGNAAPPTRAFSRNSTAASSASHGIPISSSLGGAVPSGRLEMLAWLEHRSGRSVESIEGLRDGISYAFVLADIIASASDVSISSKAQQAFEIVDHKIDRKIGPTVLSQAPSQDSIQITEACERNLMSLQAMIRACVPKRLGIEMDVPKMAKGPMQDHMLFLKWLVNLPKKIPPQAASAVGTVAAVVAATTPTSTTKRTSTPSKTTNNASSAGGVGPTPMAVKGTVNRGPHNTAAMLFGPEDTPKAISAAAEPTIVSALLSIQREIERLEELAIAKGAAASGAAGGNELISTSSLSSSTPPLTFADVQLRMEHRDALSGTLSQIAELVALSAEKAAANRSPACPLQLELQRIFGNKAKFLE